MFSKIPEVSAELAENLVAQGFFTFDDLSVIEPDQLAELGGLTEEQCESIVAYADEEAARVEEEERRAIAEGRLRGPEPGAETSEVAVESGAPGGNGAPKTASESEEPIAEAAESAEAEAAEIAAAEAAEDEAEDAAEASGGEGTDEELHDEALAEEAAHSGAEDNGQEPPTLAETALDRMTEASGEIADEAADTPPEPPETEPPTEIETSASEATRSKEGGAG
jgi:N utilization substance protein A